MHSLIFLPGTLLSHESCAEIQSLLQHRVVSMRTEILGECETLDAEISRLADTVRSPQVWVGHSLGGIAAINLALNHPEKCAALVCISATARADAATNRDKRMAQLRRAQAAGSCEPISLEMKPVFGLCAGSPMANSLVTQAETVGVRRFTHQTAYALTRPDSRCASTRIACPLMAIVGEDDDICPPVLSDEIVALSASRDTAHCICIKGAGHLAPMTHAAEIATYISRFLNLLESKRAA